RPPLYFCAPFCTKECCTMLRIVPVKAFKDNYVWTLRNATHAAVVDPGEARPVLDYLSRERLELAAILATHHHPDHVGGIAELVYASLQKLRALPDETKVYCGHEYTLANIGFAKTVEPGNAALEQREARDQRLRAAGKPTLPSTLGEEKATNPFLRCLEPAVVESANKYLGARIADPVRVFAAIRDWKNRF